jgi:hypothetical protein
MFAGQLGECGQEWGGEEKSKNRCIFMLLSMGESGNMKVDMGHYCKFVLLLFLWVACSLQLSCKIQLTAPAKLMPESLEPREQLAKFEA